MRKLFVLLSGILVFAPAVLRAQHLYPSPAGFNTRNCDDNKSGLCVDRFNRKNYEGEYVGHDEPALLFYSNQKGSGSSSYYTVRLPKDPPTKPRQDGTGGVYNFQLHPAFWFGMALCDTQSAPNPNPNGVCNPATDDNIFESTDPKSKTYLGNHPGTAFLELQFYPPGWIGTPGPLISDTQYLAALNIDSVSLNLNTLQDNNTACLNLLGEEPVNFAEITTDGVPFLPPNPLGVPFGNFTTDPSHVLLMNPGDMIQVAIFDTPAGIEVTLNDLTTGQSGFMIAGPASGFGQVNFQPTAKTCTVTPYAFHPMYSTSSELTRVPWAVHTYNIAFSDEIGHFEFCNAFSASGPNVFHCTVPGVNDPKVDDDDFPCANPAFFGLPSTFQQITGCLGADLDFNGTPYLLSWPGTGPAATDVALHPQPILFSSAQFLGPGNSGLRNYDRVAFETDLPSNEIGCTESGAGCVIPSPGTLFYPIFSTTLMNGQCMWQFGGPNIPATTNNFGGNATAQFGPLLSPEFSFGGTTVPIPSDFRQVLNQNPCKVN